MKKIFSDLKKDKIFLFLFLSGILIRLYGIGSGLPFMSTVADEDGMISKIYNIIENKDLNLHWFFYPSLYFYIAALFTFIIYGFYKIFIYFFSLHYFSEVVQENLVSKTTVMPLLFFSARFVSAVSGIIMILIIYNLMKKYFGKHRVENIAVMLLVVSPYVVLLSHYGKPDSIQLLFVALVILFSFKVYEKPDLKNLNLSGVFLAGALTTKYSGILAGINLIIAVILRFFEKKDGFKKLILNSAVIFFSFIISVFFFSPYSFLDFEAFRKDFYRQSVLFKQDLLARSFNPWTSLINALIENIGLIGFIFFIFSMIFLFKRVIFNRENKFCLLIIQPIFIYFFLALTHQFEVRHVFPVIPSVLIICAFFFYFLNNFLEKHLKRIRVPLFFGFLLLVMIQPVYKLVDVLDAITNKSVEFQCWDWTKKKLNNTMYAFEMRCGLNPSQNAHLFYSFGESDFKSFKDSDLEFLIVSDSIKNQYLRDEKRKRIFPYHYSAYKWINENSYLIKVFKGKSLGLIRSKIFVYKLYTSRKESVDNETIYFDVSYKNNGKNQFYLTLDKQILLKIFPERESISKEIRINIERDSNHVISIFTQVDYNGNAVDSRGYLNIDIKISSEIKEFTKEINQIVKPNEPYIGYFSFQKNLND
ncbi:MAG: glycosyltransferase family 39 protein [Acidobacteriota bacterium]